MNEVRESSEVLEPARAQALAALFDDGLTASAGDELPPLWHWATLPSWPGSRGSGPDGHPATGGFIPDVGKPRRMFAGGSVEFHVPLRIGEQVRRRDSVISVEPKSGRQGDFVLVEVESLIYDSQERIAIREVQNLIYREAEHRPHRSDQEFAAADLVPSLLAKSEDSWEFRTDPTKLMRFSAATSNGHRIHYDLAYATLAEGYPGLVVHGPLMTLALLEVARLDGIGKIRELSHRNVRPLFCGQPAQVLVERVSESSITLTLVGPDGPCCIVDSHSESI